MCSQCRVMVSKRCETPESARWKQMQFLVFRSPNHLLPAVNSSLNESKLTFNSSKLQLKVKEVRHLFHSRVVKNFESSCLLCLYITHINVCIEIVVLLSCLLYFSILNSQWSAGSACRPLSKSINIRKKYSIEVQYIKVHRCSRYDY